MNKKILVIGFWILFASAIIVAEEWNGSSTSGIKTIYEFENNLDDETGNFTLVVAPAGNVPYSEGYNYQGVVFSGENVGIHDFLLNRSNIGTPLKDNGAIEAWIYINETGYVFAADRTIYMASTAAGENRVRFYVNKSGNLIGGKAKADNTLEYVNESDFRMPLKEWVHVIFSWNSTDLVIYVNGTETQKAVHSNQAFGGTYNGFCIGVLCVIGSSQQWPFKGVMDNFVTFDVFRNQSEALSDYTAFLKPTVTQNEPSDGYLTDGENVRFNCTVVANFGNLSNSSFYIYYPNDSLYIEKNFIYTTPPQTNNATPYFYENLSIDGTWDWYCDAYSADGNYDYSTNRTVLVDTIKPSLSLVKPRLEGNLSNISLTFTIYDNTTVSCYYSVDGSANQSVGCNNNSVQVSTSIDITSLGVTTNGNHTLILYVNDSLSNNDSATNIFDVVPVIDSYYQEEAVETEILKFNVTINDINSIVSSMTLKYDNTDYTGALINTVGHNKTYESYVSSSAITGGTIERKFFNWTSNGIVDSVGDTHTFPTDNHTVAGILLSQTTP